MASSPRLYLEELSEEKHLHGVHSLYSDPRNLEGCSFPPVTDLEDSRQWVRKRSKVTNPNIENFAIMVPASSPLYGISTLTDNDDTESQAGEASAPSLAPVPSSSLPPKMIGVAGILRVSPPELGYIVKRPWWGRGVASEAVALALDRYWAVQPGVDAVEAYIDVANRASGRVAARAGFVHVPERTVPAGGTLPNGQDVDVDVGVWVLKRPSATTA